jgi:hypothetical protein
MGLLYLLCFLSFAKSINEVWPARLHVSLQKLLNGLLLNFVLEGSALKTIGAIKFGPYLSNLAARSV